jgi:hypothetical protein
VLGDRRWTTKGPEVLGGDNGGGVGTVVLVDDDDDSLVEMGRQFCQQQHLTTINL